MSRDVYKQENSTWFGNAYVNCDAYDCSRQRKHGPRYRTDLNVGREGVDNDVDVMFDAHSGSVRLDGSRGFQNIMYRDDKEKVLILCITLFCTSDSVSLKKKLYEFV